MYLSDDLMTIDTLHNFANLTACDEEEPGRTFVKIVFTHNAGDLPALIPDVSKLELPLNSPGGGVVNIFTDGAYADSKNLIASMSGTTENLECNGRGLCDHSNGKCQCFDGYSSSDGSGLIGDSGDCGYRVITGPKGEL